jgi:hypothetical protein
MDCRSIFLRFSVQQNHQFNKLIASSEENPKFEYRNPKQTLKQMKLKSGKSKTSNSKEARLEFDLFCSFEIVSNFGFRASKLLFLTPLVRLSYVIGHKWNPPFFYRHNLKSRLAFSDKIFFLTSADNAR